MANKVFTWTCIELQTNFRHWLPHDHQQSSDQGRFFTDQNSWSQSQTLLQVTCMWLPLVAAAWWLPCTAAVSLKINFARLQRGFVRTPPGYGPDYGCQYLHSYCCKLTIPCTAQHGSTSLLIQFSTGLRSIPTTKLSVGCYTSQLGGVLERVILVPQLQDLMTHVVRGTCRLKCQGLFCYATLLARLLFIFNYQFLGTTAVMSVNTTGIAHGGAEYVYLVNAGHCGVSVSKLCYWGW